MKELYSSILFPQLQREFQKNPQLAGNLKGLFVVTVYKKEKKEVWYLLFNKNIPLISQEKPSVKNIPVVLIDVENDALLKFITGGLNGVKGIISRKVNIVGDLLLAQQLEVVFIKAGGIEKAKEFIKNFQSKL